MQFKENILGLSINAWLSAPCRWSWVSTVGSPTRRSTKQRVSWAAVWRRSASVQSTTLPSSARREPTGSLLPRPVSCTTSDVSGGYEAVRTQKQSSGTSEITPELCVFCAAGLLLPSASLRFLDLDQSALKALKSSQCMHSKFLSIARAHPKTWNFKVFLPAF